MTDALDLITLDNVAELDPEPHTRGRQSNARKCRTGLNVWPQIGPNMLQAALWYAKRGWHVFPLHAPIFDGDGACVGCTCEAWKRTHYNKPDYKCPQPGKCPAVRWAEKSTTDPDQIRKWWGHPWKTTNAETGVTDSYTPNIGIDCGKSDLLVLDRDSYKDGYADLPSVGQAQRQTVTSLTGSGGEQLLYAMQGKNYSNATGDLPYGNDIRGAGGYIVAPPSLHKSGRRYQFEDGYNPTEIELQPIPAALQAILDVAKEKAVKAKNVTFAQTTTDKPDLIRWHISKETRALIGAPGTGDRSANDMKVCVSLCYAGASDDDILAVYEHYPIGTDGKYAEAGQRYLALTIGKARAYVEANPPLNVAATLAPLRLYNKTHVLADCLPAGKGSKRVRPVVDGVLDAMEADQRLTITIGKKRLAKLAGVDPNTAHNVLKLLNGRLFNVTYSEHGATIELPPLTLVSDCRLYKFHPSLSIVLRAKTGGEICTNDKNAYTPHKADETFLTGTSRYMKDFIQSKSIELTIWHEGELVQEVGPQQVKEQFTIASAGEGVLLAYDTWLRGGDMTAQEYATETGLKLSAARTHLRKAEIMGLAGSEREGSRGPKIYTFIPEFWEKIAELAPKMRTHKMSSRREDKRLEAAQQWAKKELDEAKQAQDIEETQRLNKRFAHLAKQRLPHLERLYPALSADDIKRLAYEVAGYKRSPKTEQAVRTERNAQREEHRETVTMIRELALSIADVGTPTVQIFDETMKYDVFDARLVRDVLQSKTQMARYDTLDEVRRRLDYAEKTTLPPLATVQPQPSQPALVNYRAAVYA